MVIAPFLEQVLYLHSLGSQGEGQNFFLGVLGLGYFQFEITTCQRDILGWQILLPYTGYVLLLCG